MHYTLLDTWKPSSDYMSLETMGLKDVCFGDAHVLNHGEIIMLELISCFRLQHGWIRMIFGQTIP